MKKRCPKDMVESKAEDTFPNKSGTLLRPSGEGYGRASEGQALSRTNWKTSPNMGETEAMGRRLARFLRPGDVVALTGDLGSGKTTFTKGIAAGLGVADSAYVNSPSFVLIKEYRAPALSKFGSSGRRKSGANPDLSKLSSSGRRKDGASLYHFDLYRLDDLGEIEYIGLEDYLKSDGVLVIEWAEKLKDMLPDERLHICIDIVSKNRRRFNFTGHGKRYDTISRRYLKS